MCSLKSPEYEYERERDTHTQRQKLRDRKRERGERQTDILAERERQTDREKARKRDFTTIRMNTIGKHFPNRRLNMSATCIQNVFYPFNCVSPPPLPLRTSIQFGHLQNLSIWTSLNFVCNRRQSITITDKILVISMKNLYFGVV